MTIPEKAIICTPSYGDAVKLDAFFREYTNRYVPLNMWDEYGEETCWDLCEEDSDHRLVNMSYGNYDEAIEDFEATGENDRYIPADPGLRFLSVDSFIALCVGAECPEDEDVEVGDLL